MSMCNMRGVASSLWEVSPHTSVSLSFMSFTVFQPIVLVLQPIVILCSVSSLPSAFLNHQAAEQTVSYKIVNIWSIYCRTAVRYFPQEVAENKNTTERRMNMTFSRFARNTNPNEF